MNSRSASLLVALALAGCSGGGGTEEKKTGTDGKVAPPAAVDLEAECRAAAASWKTLKAVYKAEGAKPATVTLAVERGSRVAIRTDGGNFLIIEGGWYHVGQIDPAGHKVKVEIPMGSIFAAVMAIRDGRELPPRGGPPPIPEGHIVADLGLQEEEGGTAGRVMSLSFQVASRSVFGWLDLLHPAEGVTIRADGRAALVSGPMGRVSIDRDNGALLEWILEPPQGPTARLKAESVETDRPLDSGLFGTPGDFPAPPEAVRAVERGLLLRSTADTLSEENGRTERLLKIARAYYRIAWTEGDLDDLARNASARRDESAATLRRDHPDATDQDIADASGPAAKEALMQALSPAYTEDVATFARALGVPRTDIAEFAAPFEQAINEEVWAPVWKRLAKR